MGSGPAPRRALAAAVTAALLATAPLGCAGPDPAADGATTFPASAEPQTVCTTLITHWANDALDALDAGQDPDAVGLDYQSKGLSGGQNEILRAVLAEARAERDARGPAAARQLAARETERRCAERYRSGAPTDGPWQ